MDMASPITSVIPSAHGPVLAALVRAGVPLSGRQIAALVEGQVSRSRVNSVLSELAVSGLVLREPHPPSVLYQFNRQHVAADLVAGLAELIGAVAHLHHQLRILAAQNVSDQVLGAGGVVEAAGLLSDDELEPESEEPDLESLPPLLPESDLPEPPPPDLPLA